MESQPVAWTPERIEAFWSYWAQRPEARRRSLSRTYGKGVCKFLSHTGPLHGRQVLDFGTGRGHLVEQLLQRGASVSAVEISDELVQDLNRRFQRDRAWGEARLWDGKRVPWEDNQFDVVCCLDHIEHLLARDLDTVVLELKRVVKPGGAVLFTTPNSENLQSQTVLCPNCCSEFHRWQHVRRWTPESLGDRLSSAGYDVRFCDGLNFRDFQPKLRLSDLAQIQFLPRVTLSATLSVLDHYQPRPFPHGRRLQQRIRQSNGTHLVAVAYKPMEASDATNAEKSQRQAGRHAAA